MDETTVVDLGSGLATWVTQAGTHRGWAIELPDDGKAYEVRAILKRNGDVYLVDAISVTTVSEPEWVHSSR